MNKLVMSYISFISAIIIGFICVFIPPKGIIDTSVLWFVAQLLTFTASILCIDYNVFKTN